MYNPFSLKGKTIFVTGASSGIGRATATECTKLGATVVISGRNEQRLCETYNMLEGSGHIKIVADLSVEDDLSGIIKQMPEIDGIVHAAGLIQTLLFQFMNKTDLANIFDVNFFAPVLLTQKMLQAKKFKKESSIVFISSIEGSLIAHFGNSMYSASKGAVTAMVKNMALDLAPKKIRVNCVLPGMTETPFINLESIMQEQLDADMKLYPLKRYGKPEEIAYAVIYLLSDASAWVTGTNLLIDGGFTIL